MGRVIGLWLPVLLAASQDAAGPDRLIYLDRSESRGELAGLDPSGALLFGDSASGCTLNVSPEEVWELSFEGDAAPADEKPGEESIRFSLGGGLSGRRVRFEKDEAVLEHAAGVFRVRRAEVRLLTLAAPAGALPEIKEGAEDVVIL